MKIATVITASLALFSAEVVAKGKGKGKGQGRTPGHRHLEGNCVRRGNRKHPHGTCLVLDHDKKVKHIPCIGDQACPDDGKTHYCYWPIGFAVCGKGKGKPLPDPRVH